MSGETGRTNAITEFSRLLAQEDFSGDADRMLERLEHLLRSTGVPLREEDSTAAKARKKSAVAGRAAVARSKAAGAGKPKPPAEICAEIQRLIDTYPRASAGYRAAEGAVVAVNYNNCPKCNSAMSVDSGISMLRCTEPECSVMKELTGTVFEDSNFFGGNETLKPGRFNPNRHYQFWIMHIMAREPEDEIGDKDDPDNMYGEKLIKALRERVARDRMILRFLTVYEVRAMLGGMTPSRTTLNKNVPLIMKKLTGSGPPQISEIYLVRAENLFSKVIEIAEIITRTTRVNRNYYPYYIYKIFEGIIPESDYESRRILYYIYIQNDGTVEADDEDWRQICEELGEIAYVPTDRSAAMKYRP